MGYFIAFWVLGFVICLYVLWSNQVSVLRGRGMSSEQVNAYMNVIGWPIFAFAVLSWITLALIVAMELDERNGT